MNDDLISRSALLEQMHNHYEARNPKQNATMDECCMMVIHAPAVDAETVIKSLPYVKEALEMAKQSLTPVVRCIDCRYSKTCKRTIELIPRQAQIGYLRCVVHSCEYGERRADDATD